MSRFNQMRAELPTAIRSHRSPDLAASIALDRFGNLYIQGSTFSTDHPRTPGAFQPGSQPDFRDEGRETPGGGCWRKNQESVARIEPFVGSEGGNGSWVRA